MIELTYWQLIIIGFFAFIGFMTSIFAVWFVTTDLKDEPKKSESEMFK